MAERLIRYQGTVYRFPEQATNDQIKGYFARNHGAEQAPSRPSYTEEFTNPLVRSSYGTAGNVAQTTADAMRAGTSLAGNLPVFGPLVAQGMEGVANYYQGQATQMQAAEEAAPGASVNTYQEGFSSLDNFARYTLGMLGASTPETALGVVGGVTGSAIGTTTAAINRLGPVASRGMELVGSYLGASGGVLPNFYGENIQAQIEAGVPPDQVDRARAFSAALSQSQLSAAFDTILAGRITRIANPANWSRTKLRDALAAPFVGAAIEVPTEVAQEAIQLYQANPDLILDMSPETLEHLTQTAVGAAVLGSVINTGTEVSTQVAESLLGRRRMRGETVTPPRKWDDVYVTPQEREHARLATSNDEVTRQMVAMADSATKRFGGGDRAANSTPQNKFYTTEDGTLYAQLEDGRQANLSKPQEPISGDTIFVSKSDAARLTKHQSDGSQLFVKYGKAYPAKTDPKTGKLVVNRQYKSKPITLNSKAKKGMVPVSLGGDGTNWTVGTPVTKILPQKITDEIQLAQEAVTPQDGPDTTGPLQLPAAPQTEEFKNWFGNSMIVDDEGKPLPLYHGTHADFTSFDGDKDSTATSHGWYGTGFYFTDSPNLAGSYAGTLYNNANIIPAYVSLKNPYMWPPDAKGPVTKKDSDALTEELRGRGYDGVIVVGRDWNGNFSGFDEVVVFDPENIKSVFNKGTFDPNTANMSHSPGDKFHIASDEERAKYVPTNFRVSRTIPELRRFLKRIAPGAKVFATKIPDVVGTISTTQGEGTFAIAGQQWANIIDLGLQVYGKTDDQYLSLDTAFHEAIHYLDRNGFFTEEEQNIIEDNLPELASRASQMSQSFEKNGQGTPASWYMGEGAANVAERSIRRAEALALGMQTYLNDKNWAEAVRQGKPLLERVFDKIKKFFQGVGRIITRQTGKTRIEDIFEKVYSGEIGNRTPEGQGFSSMSRYAPIVKTIDDMSMLSGISPTSLRQRLSGTEVLNKFRLPKIVYASDSNSRPGGHYKNVFGMGRFYADTTDAAAGHKFDTVDALGVAHEALERNPDRENYQLGYSMALQASRLRPERITAHFVGAKNLFRFAGKAPKFLSDKFPQLRNVSDLETLIKSADRDFMRQVADAIRQQGHGGIVYNTNGSENYALFDEDAVNVHYNDPKWIAANERRLATQTLYQARHAVTPPSKLDPAMRRERDTQIYWGDSVGGIGRFLSTARHLAARYAPFAAVYAHAQKIKSMRTFVQAEAMRNLEPYDLVADKSNIHAALELQRHRGKPETEYRRDRDGNVIFVNDVGDLSLTKNGDVVRLSPPEFAGYEAYRKTMKNLFGRIKTGVIREQGEFKVPTGYSDDGSVMYDNFYIPEDATGKFIKEQAKTAQLQAKKLEKAAETNATAKRIHRDLVALNERLKALGTKIEGMEKNMEIPYAPFMRFGDTLIRGIEESMDEDGNVTKRTVHLSATEGTETQLGFFMNKGKVNAAIKELQEKYPDAHFEVEGNTRDGSMSRVKTNPEAFDALLGLLNTNDLESYTELRETVGAILKDKGFNAHLNKADLIPGYSTDFDRSAKRYVNLISSAIAKMHYGADIYDTVNKMPGKDMVTDPNVGKSGLAMKQYAEKYADYTISPQEELSWMRQLTFVSTLGFAPDSAALQAFSVIQFTAPQMFSMAGVPKGIKYLSGAMRDAGRIMSNYYKFMLKGGAHGVKREVFGKQFVDMSHPDIVGFLDKQDEIDALLDAYQSGSLKALLTLDALGITSESRLGAPGSFSKYAHAAGEAAGHMFNTMETFSRIVTYLANYRMFRDNPEIYNATKEFYRVNNKLFAQQTEKVLNARDGKEPSEEQKLREASKFMVEEMMGMYGKENTPQYMRSGLMKLIGMFQSWVQQMLELQLRLIRTTMDKKADRQSKKIAAGMLIGINTSLLMAGGMFGNFAMENVKDLTEVIVGWATKKDINLDKEIREWAYNLTDSPQLGEWLTKGPLSEWTGLDLSARAAIQDLPMISVASSILFGTGRAGDALGVPGSMLVGNTKRIFEQTAYGVPLHEAFLKNLPLRAGANLVQAYYWNQEGVYTNTRNRVLAPPGQAKEGEPELSYWDVAAKTLGFTTNNVSMERELFYTQAREANSLDGKSRVYRERIIDALTKSYSARRGGDEETAAAYRDFAREVVAELRAYNKSVPRNERVTIDFTSLQREVVNNVMPGRRAIQGAPGQKKRDVNELEKLFPLRRNQTDE